MDYAAAVKKLAGSGDALPRPVIQKEVNRVAQQPAPQQNQPASPVVKRNIDKDSLPPSYFSLLPSNFIKDLIAHLGPEAVSMLANTNHFGNIVFGSREVWNKFKLKNLSLTPLSVRVAVQIPHQNKDQDADDKKEEEADDQAGTENENNGEHSEGRYTTVKELLQRDARLKTLADRLLSEVDKQGKALKLNGGFRFYQKGQNQNTPLGIECTQLSFVSKWLEAVADMFKDKQRVQLPVNDKEEITLQRLGRAGRILKAILPGDKPAVYFTFEDFAAGVYQQGLNLSKMFDKLDESIAAREKRFPDQAAFKDNLKTLREKFNKKALDAALNETRGWFTKSTTYAQLGERIKGTEEKKKKVATRIKSEYKDMHTFINIPAVKEYFPAQDESEPEPEPAPVVAAPENGVEPAEKKDTKKGKKNKKEQPAQAEQPKRVTPKAAPKETGPDDFSEDPRNVRLQRKRDLQSESRDSQEGKPEAPKPKEPKPAAPTPAPTANSAAKSFTDKNFFDIIVNKSEKDVEKMLQEPVEKPAAKPKAKPKQQDKPKQDKPVTSAPQPAATPAPTAAKKQAQQPPKTEAKTEKPKDTKKEKPQPAQPPKEKQPKEKKPKEKKVTVVEPTPAPQPPKEKKPKKQPVEPTRKPAAPAQLDKDTQNKLKKVASKNKGAKGGALQQLQDELLNNPKQLAIGAAAALLALVLYYMMSNKQ